MSERPRDHVQAPRAGGEAEEGACGASAPISAELPARSRAGNDVVSWIITLGALGALATYLAISRPPAHDPPRAANAAADVQLTERGTLRVPSTGPFAKQLKRVTVAVRRTSEPLIEATGSVLAALPPTGPARSPARWQFATGELLAMHAEQVQAESDIAFQAQLRQTTKLLHDAKVRTQVQVVERLRRLVEIGSEPARDLAAEEAKLEEAKLETDRQLREVDNAIEAARRKQAALARQLEQAGLPTELLRTATRGQVVLVAEIPESRIDQVREGQRATIRFFSHPNAPATGNVASVLPTVSTAQRTLRVAIVLDDARSALRPGMFASVGLGTDEREAIAVPATAVLHVGRSDYVLVASGDELAITLVSLGESRGADIEIATGLARGAIVMSDGAILLKPAVAAAVASRGGAGARP